MEFNLNAERLMEFKKTAELRRQKKLTHGVVAMNHKAFSHVGLYLSTLDPDKTREFYEAFWVLISNRRHDKDQRRRAHTDSRPPQDPLGGNPPLVQGAS